VALVGPAYTQDNYEQDKKSIEAFYTTVVRLVQKNDNKGVAALLEQKTTEDWTATDASGKLHSRAQQIEVQRGPTTGHSTSIEGKFAILVSKITFQGEQARVESTQKVTSTDVDTEGRYGTKGTKHLLIRLEPVQDTWVKRAGAWKLNKSVSYPIKLLVDGKPAKP